MPIPQITISRGNNGLGRTVGSDEGVAALVMGGVAVTGGVALNTVYILRSLRYALKTLKLTPQYDLQNKVLVNYHISEFFRMNPTGELHVMLVQQGTTLATMVTPSANLLKKVLKSADGAIRKAAIVLNPTATYTSTLNGGLDADVLAAIPLAQALADSEYAEFRPINNILIEGREFNGSIGAASDLRVFEAPDVSICIAQDPNVAALDQAFNKTAAVGTVLGVSTNKTASECFAQPKPKNNFTSVAQARFLGNYLSSGQPLNTFDAAEINALYDKGYIFARSFAHYAGLYANQSHVCVSEIDDYSFSEMRDVMNRAVRLVRPILTQHINSTEFIVQNGRIAVQHKRMIEAEIRTALLAMQSDVSELTTVLLDPATDDQGQPYPSFLQDKSLRVIIGYIPKGKAEQIFVEIGNKAA
jgi:hypothetical protein